MDDRLAKALDHANYKVSLARRREALRLRFLEDRRVAVNGGLFTASPDLVSFVDWMIRRGDKEAVLIDDRENPIKVENLEKFLDDLASTYHEAVNSYHADHEKLRKARTVKQVVGIS